jgi:hypothetical protein
MAHAPGGVTSSREGHACNFLVELERIRLSLAYLMLKFKGPHILSEFKV